MSDPFDGLTRDWDFVPSRATPTVRAVRIFRSLRRRRRAPHHAVIKPLVEAARWTCYFAYLPDGRLTAAHRFTLERLAAEPGKLLVVCACPEPGLVPQALADAADALLWKAMPGFDFSAYALALNMVARFSPGADAMVMNDSVFGPFTSLAEAVGDAPWDFCGFTASSGVENHIQSYAFQMRQVTPARLRAMRSVLPQHTAYDRYQDVVLCQETQLARVASRSMSTGSLWFADVRRAKDPSLYKAVELVDAGLPFLKRSLLGRLAHLNDPERVREVLRAKGHPLDL